jgi:SNF2 family DNA or RNA helicase
MSLAFTPKPHQLELYTWLHNVKRSAQFSFMGSGKTSACLTAFEDLSLTENVYPLLIVAPLRVAVNTWPSEINKWEHTKHLTASLITGTVKQRDIALNTPADIYITNYENLPWLVETLGKKWPFKSVIADECTRLKGFRTRQGSTRAKALAKVAHTLVERIVLLTGTPAPNGLLDLWGQIWFIDKGERLGKSYSAYLDEWFYPHRNGFTWLPKENAQKEIQEAIADICITVKAEDWFPLDKPIVNRIILQLPKKAKRLYAEMKRKMYMELENEGHEAFTAGSMMMQCRQIASGAIYSKNDVWEEIHDEKITALDSVIAEANGMPVMVVYHFRHDLERLQKAFPKGRVLDKSKDTEDAWNKGKIPLLFVHPASSGLGLNLQDGGNILVFFSLDWSMENHVQVIERLGPMRQLQAGHKRSVFLHYLLMEDTIDEIIYERLATKKSVQEVLTNAMNRYKERDHD